MASLVKTVEMRILADAGDAQAKLDELDAKADELGAEGVKMRFRLDDAEGQAQLDDIKAKADELGFKDVSIKVKVDGAGRAIAELAAVKHEADAAGGGEDGGGLLSKLFGDGLSVPEGIPLIGGMGPLGLGAIAAGVAALLPEIVAVGSGFAAAGTGAAAFAALAYPAIKSVETALSDTPAQLKKLNLSPDESGAVSGIKALEAEYAKMSKAFQPQAFKVFNDGLQVASTLLPHLAPFADTFANSLGGLLKQLDQFTQSSGFTGWLKQFQSLEGPAVTAIGTGIGNVVNALGKLMTTFSGKDVANGINIAFGAISGTISGIRIAIEGLKTAWDDLSDNSTFKKIASDFAQAWDSISKTGKQKPDFSGLEKGLEGAVSTAVTWLGSKAGPLLDSALTTASQWLDAHAGSILEPAGAAIMEGLLKGLESQLPSLGGFLGKVATFIAEHKGPLDYDRQLLVPHGQAMIQGLIAGMASMQSAIEAAAKKVATAFTSHIKTELAYAKSVAASAISGLSLTSIDLTAGTVSTGMQSYLATLKSFTADIKALSGEHLNKSLLQQLIAAGPVTGDQYAQSILTGGGAGQVNALYSQIVRQSAVLGAQAANSVYGGKNIAANNGTIDVNVTVALDTTKQDLALQIVKILKEYKRNGGGSALGIA